MAVTSFLLNDTTLEQIGDGSDDLITGDLFFEGDFRPNDVMFGGDGDDGLNGGTGTNVMHGEGGNDNIFVGATGAVFDQAFGDDGSDTFEILTFTGVGGATHMIDGGNGHDVLFSGLHNSSEGVLVRNGMVTNEGQTGATFVGIEELIGTSRADTVFAGNGLFQVQGLDGDDQITGGDGQFNLLSGGRGNDSLTGGDVGDEIYDGDERLSTGTVLPRFYDDSDTIKGGLGDDTLLGYSGDDQIFGNAGNDSLYSVLGNATLKGGDGDDFFGFTYWTFYDDVDPIHQNGLARSQHNLGGLNIQGGKGIDEVSFAGVFVSPSSGDIFFDKGVNVNLKSGTGFEMSSGTDRSFIIEGVENLTATDRDDKLIGTGAANRLDGVDGNDTILGRDGNDTLIGGAGKDVLKGGNDNDVLDGLQKADKLIGGAGNDTLMGGKGNDKLKGGAGQDVLVGGVGNDKLTGGQGQDVFEFQASLLPGDSDKITDFDLTGDLIRIQHSGPLDFADLSITDTSAGAMVAFQSWSVVLKGVNAADLSAQHFGFEVRGTAGADVLQGSANADAIDGLQGDDQIKGAEGKDTLDGGAGQDTLLGGKGRDLLIGGTGNDKLTGGAGQDVFEFSPAKLSGDADRIKDFDPTEDIVRLVSATPLTFDELTLQAKDAGVKVVHDGWSVMLEGVNVADLSADQFDFLIG